MQILPTSSSVSAAQFDSRNAAGDSRDFFRMFAEYMENVPAEITPYFGDSGRNTADAIDEAFFTAQAPYDDARQSETTASNVRLTESELLEAAESLRREGADEEIVRKVEELAGNPGGASVEDVVRAAAQEEPARLSEEDLTRIEALLNEIDPTGELSGSVLEELRNGRVDNAWGLIKSAVNGLDPSQVLSVDKDQILSLGKALRLSADALSALEKNFFNQESLQVTLKGLNDLLSPAAGYMNRRAESRSKLAEQLESALAPVIKNARKRIEAEQAAAGRTSRDIQYSETMIRDTVTRNGITRQNEAAEGKAAAEAARPEDEKSRLGTMKKDGEASNTEKNAAKAVAQPGADRSARQNAARSGKDADGSRSGFGEADRRAASAFTAQTTETGKQSGSIWDAMLQRLNVQTPANGVNTSLHQASALQTAGRGADSLASRVLSQVEQGMLSALRDGSKRLELQLNPETLGTLSVVLTSRKGEVSAVLRPERSETAALLAQQTEHLRALLEQQGIKVDKVEVQTQLQDNRNAMNWQGMEQHNESQERQARSAQMERNRRLIRMRGAAEVAVSARSSVLAEQGLHLVA